MAKVPGKIIEIFEYLDSVAETAVGRQELSELVETMATLLADSKMELKRQEERIKEELEKFKSELQKADTTSKASASQTLQDFTGRHQAELAAMRELVAKEIAKVRDLIPELPEEFDASSLEEALRGHQEALDSLTDLTTGENIRNALEALPEGDKLAMSAIEGLETELEKIRATKTSVQTGVTGRDIITKYDLSPYLDGSTKTFNIPATWAVISVACSSFPNVLRPTIDYTNTNTTITFTNEIEASTTLAAGQTVVLILVTA